MSSENAPLINITLKRYDNNMWLVDYALTSWIVCTFYFNLDNDWHTILISHKNKFFTFRLDD